MSARLEQVLVNLINNARDAGGSTISVAASTVERGGRPLVRIAVEDPGPGIAPEVLSRLFVAFVTTKARGKGTGLGLRICRRIVEEMDGEITARNRAEGGAQLRDPCCRQRRWNLDSSIARVHPTAPPSEFVGQHMPPQ